MATPTSSVPRAKAALMRLFAADATLSQVKAFPSAVIPSDRLPHEFIMLGRPNDGRFASWSQTPKIGNQTRDEVYTLYLTITVGQGGYDTDALDARGVELLSAFELALWADPELKTYNGGQPIGQPFGVDEYRSDASAFPSTDAGLVEQIVIELDCHASLRNQ